MLWLVLILVAIGAAFYIVDKKIKEKYKFEEKFNPEDWNLPESPEIEDIKPQVALTAPVPSAAEKVIYKKKDSVLLAAKENFYSALHSAVPNNYNILTNINAADVLGIASNSSSLAIQVATKNIASKQFDFILCEKQTLSPVCVITLNESLPLFLSNACESAQLPVVIFPAQMNYDIELLREKIFQAVNKIAKRDENLLDETTSITISDSLEIRATDSGVEKEELAEKESVVVKEEIIQKEEMVEKEEKTENDIEFTFCPDCSAVMLKRKAKNGVNAGKMFWICSTYPTCRGMRPV
jgi:hypothetical protein